MIALPNCDCTSYCGDDDAIHKGTAKPCANHIRAELHRQLIAAAPDLLEACNMAEAFMAGFEDDPAQEGIDVKLRIIRNALAKAAGIKS